ncbi:MAG: hypothetical protein WBQ06_02265, partial [Acidobacteriaceae bacterium]
MNLKVPPSCGGLGIDQFARVREMCEPREKLASAAQTVSPDAVSSPNSDVEFRRDLAFPKLSEEMLERLGSYGQEETVPKDTCLYMYGDR